MAARGTVNSEAQINNDILDHFNMELRELRIVLN